MRPSLWGADVLPAGEAKETWFFCKKWESKGSTVTKSELVAPHMRYADPSMGNTGTRGGELREARVQSDSPSSIR